MSHEINMGILALQGDIEENIADAGAGDIAQRAIGMVVAQVVVIDV